jgi:large subunit ribosomal protein L15
MSMIHEITEAAPRWKKPMRKGRGESSGKGKTCGKGNKGSKARNGKYIKRGYEGGQTPIFKRFPKRGFSNVNFTVRYNVINLAELETLDGAVTVDQALLVEKGLIPDNKLGFKVLGQGELTKKLTVQADWFSKSAHEAITKAGGTALNAKGTAFEFPKEKKKFIPRDKVKKVEAPPAADGEKKE